jgi:hypothetical protein
MSNLPSLPGGMPSLPGGNLPSSIPGLPGGIPSSLPSLPSASSLASGGFGSGGNLPSSIPGAGLLPNPIPGNYRAQVAQGQALFQAAQNVAAGNPGSVATLLQGAATVAANNMSSGLPKTLVLDAAGIAAGFAMGGPVGGAVAVAGAALGAVTALFSGTGGVTWEGFEAQPSDASVRNWTLVQNYIANLVGASESGYPPGWYLAFYMAATAPRYTLSDLTDLYLLRAGSFQAPGGEPSAIAYLTELQTGTLANLTINTGYQGDEAIPLFLKDTPWKSPNAWGPWTPQSGTPAKRWPTAKDSQFAAQLLSDSQWPHPFQETWGSGFNTVALAYLWGAPTGASLPGSLSLGITGVVTPGTPTASNLPDCSPAFPSAGPCLTTASQKHLYSQGVIRTARVSLPSILSQTLSDISDKPGMTRQSIVARAMKLAPRAIWMDPSLYQLGAVIDNSTQFTALYNLDILNALATIWVMLAVGAHPRAITTELLVQQANIYEHGGPNPGVQNLSAGYRRFMDEWLNISQGYPPDNHAAVLGQMSNDAPPEAHEDHVQNLSTLAQWVQHYLG